MDLKDPVRKLITERCIELDISHAELSRAIGRSMSYINQYLRRGSPVVLDERARYAVAKTLKLDEASLIPDGTEAQGGAVVARHQILARSNRHIPTFSEGAPIDFDNVKDFTDRPDFVTLSEHSFALWVNKDHGRLMPGDLAYVTGGRAARTGDLVVALTMDYRTIVSIGMLVDQTGDRATIQMGDGKEKQLARRSHVILKVAAIALA